MKFLALVTLLLSTTGCLRRHVYLVVQHPVIATEPEPDVHQLQERHNWYDDDAGGVVCPPEEVNWDNGCIKAKKKTQD